MAKTIKAFCAGEQKDTEHTLVLDHNGEIVVSCVTDLRTPEEVDAKDPEVAPKICGRFVKYPRGTSAEELRGHIANHKEANEGQLTVEAIEKEQDALIEALNTPEE